MVGFTPLLGVAALAGLVRSAPGSNYGSSSGSSGNSYGSSQNSYGSSNGNSYGSSNGNSYGSSNGNSYGSSGSSYNNNNNYGSSSTWSSSTQMSSSSYSMPTYGSGSMSWNMGSGYNNCVQQCVASYGGPSATASWPQETGSSMGSSGSGATHTVIVAPTQGVLRYIPFATNASVGDTVKFIWGAGPHTVTKSSQLTPCNKTSDTPFASGMQNKSFVFTQVVNDTNPVFYYCGVPGHCEKGMFGIVNPPSAFNNAGSASNMIQSIAQNTSSTGAAWSYTQNATMNNAGAMNWGSNIDMSNMPSWSMSSMAENIMYTRAFIAQNPEVMQSDGSINLGSIGSNPLMIPSDVAAASAGSNNAAAASPSSSSAASSASSSGSATSSPSTSPVSASSKSGAGAISVSRGTVALVAVAAAFFAL